ncbi:MAG TPA: response regulator transcription factor [Terriglobales bacterium]
MPVRIFVADDHDIVRAGIRSILESQPDWIICGEAEDGVQAISGICATKPDIAIVDITMPGRNGLEVAKEVSSLYPNIKVLIFTMHSAKTLVEAADDAGAHGLVLKSNADRDLIRALQALINGKTFFEPGNAPAA